MSRKRLRRTAVEPGYTLKGAFDDYLLPNIRQRYA